MGFKTIKVTEEEEREFAGGGGGAYVKLAAVGEQLAGIYLSRKPSGGQYAKPGDMDYSFLRKGADGQFETVQFTPPRNAKAAINKAEKSGMKIVPGVKFLIKLTGQRTLDGYEKPMGVFEVQIDDEVTPAALATIAKYAPSSASSAAPAAAAAPPAPKPQIADPFADDVPI